MQPIPVPEHLRESATAVVDHLSALRGGGLLLSGVDAVLLVDWLDSGIPAAVIVVALERVAERRRKRRVKSRLSLGSCKGEVKRLWKKGLPSGPAALPAPSEPSSQAGTGELERLAAQAVAALDGLGSGDPASLAERAMAVVRRFHEQAWQAAADEQARLEEQAAEELADFRGIMDPIHWDEAVEEAARDLLRQRFPQLSAVAVWDRLHAP
jgi:hypothetical protein